MLSMIPIILVAISLSMDAFSLALIYGTQGISKSKIIMLSTITGVFHYIMPTLGYIISSFLLSSISFDSHKLVGIIFLILSVQMIISLNKEENISPINNWFNIIFFAFSVSIDSFSVGIGFNAFNDNIFYSAIVFSLFSCTFTFIGLWFGNKMSEYLGKVANCIGIGLLVILSMYYLLLP